MKKIILALVVLMLASPAWAEDVVITCAQVVDTNEVVISFDATNSTKGLVRAFGLNIQLDDDATIIGVGNVNPDYYIYPGTISIDTTQTPPEIDYGTPVAEYGDLESDTLPGLGSNGVTLEMASLYAPTGPGSPNAPAKSGVLLSLYVSRPTAPDLQTCLTITGNVARAGSKGVVMEDPDLDPDVSAAGCCVDFPPVGCACPGEITGDGVVNSSDIIAIAGWLNAYGVLINRRLTILSTDTAHYDLCADVNGDDVINSADIIKMAGWLNAYGELINRRLTIVCPHSYP